MKEAQQDVISLRVHLETKDDTGHEQASASTGGEGEVAGDQMQVTTESCIAKGCVPRRQYSRDMADYKRQIKIENDENEKFRAQVMELKAQVRRHDAKVALLVSKQEECAKRANEWENQYVDLSTHFREFVDQSVANKSQSLQARETALELRLNIQQEQLDSVNKAHAELRETCKRMENAMATQAIEALERLTGAEDEFSTRQNHALTAFSEHLTYMSRQFADEVAQRQSARSDVVEAVQKISHDMVGGFSRGANGVDGGNVQSFTHEADADGDARGVASTVTCSCTGASADLIVKEVTRATQNMMDGLKSDWRDVLDSATVQGHKNDRVVAVPPVASASAPVAGAILDDATETLRQELADCETLLEHTKETAREYSRKWTDALEQMKTLRRDYEEQRDIELREWQQELRKATANEKALRSRIELELEGSLRQSILAEYEQHEVFGALFGALGKAAVCVSASDLMGASATTSQAVLPDILPAQAFTRAFGPSC